MASSNASYEVETEKLTSAAEILTDKIESYNTEWGKLYTEVQDLTSTLWQGIASEQFNKQLEGYRNDFQELATTLESFVEFLKTSASGYEGTEDEIRSAASALNTGI